MLSQRQESASRALSAAEINYSITEIERLVVVWSVFPPICTGMLNSAELETPSPSGKHVRWWLKVFGCGVSKVNICFLLGNDEVIIYVSMLKTHDQ